MNKTFDVIVVGVGSMGSAALYYLAKEGVKVLGIDQFDVPHEMGSHTGQTRLIRRAYFEHSNYVPLLHRAYENWKELEDLSGCQMYFKTGILYLGDKDHVLIKGMNESSVKYNIETEIIGSEKRKSRFPQFTIPDDHEGILEPDAGFLVPEYAISNYVKYAQKFGAELRTKEKVLGWEEKEGIIEVRTSKNIYQCKKLVLSAGPWINQLIKPSTYQLKITRQMLAWLTPKDPTPFEYGNFPCWTVADWESDGIYYGFPILNPNKFEGPVGFKLGFHGPGLESDPDKLDRDGNDVDKKMLLNFLHEFIPGAVGEITKMKACMYTYSPDEHFVLDFYKENKNVILASGFSGHGFKFASVVGEIIKDIALNGNTDLPVGFFGEGRFS